MIIKVSDKKLPKQLSRDARLLAVGGCGLPI
jgi:hypothetical protein